MSLPIASRCPKCSSLGYEVLTPAYVESALTHARCALCETQYCLPLEVEAKRALLRRAVRGPLPGFVGESIVDRAMRQLDADMDVSEAELLKLTPEERSRRWADTLEAWMPTSDQSQSFFGVDRSARELRELPTPTLYERLKAAWLGAVRGWREA